MIETAPLRRASTPSAVPLRATIPFRLAAACLAVLCVLPSIRPPEAIAQDQAPASVPSPASAQDQAINSRSQASASAQDTVEIVEIEMRDGNVFIGTILSDDDRQIVLRTLRLGDLTIRRGDIRRITRISGAQVHDGEIWYRNAHDTRYFFQSNAYNLRRGEGYYQNAWVFFNQVSYGMTDHVSIGTGFVPMFLLGEPSTPLWITPKVSIPLKQDRLMLGVGGLMGVIVGESAGFGILFGNVTAGDRDRNLTIAGGYGYAEEGGELLLGLSGSVRIRPKWALMTENYLFADQVLSFIGFRHIGRRMAIDGALLIPVGEEVAVPWVSITVPFQTRFAD